MTNARRGRPGPRRTLTEQNILDAALALLADHGAHAVTIRGIAARVAVAPNAVYTYFPDKAAVLQGLTEQLLSRVNHNKFTDPSQPWRDRIHALAHELRTELLTHPGAVHLMLGTPLNGPHAQAVNHTLHTILTDAGLNPQDATNAAHLINVHTLGSAAFHTTTTNPHTDTTRFDWGLNRLLDGLTTHATRHH